MQTARVLVQPVYDWFTERIDTLDLVEARAFLETLAPQRPAAGPGA